MRKERIFPENFSAEQQTQPPGGDPAAARVESPTLENSPIHVKRQRETVRTSRERIGSWRGPGAAARGRSRLVTCAHRSALRTPAGGGAEVVPARGAEAPAAQ